MFKVVATICLGVFLAGYATSRVKAETAAYYPATRAFFDGNDIHSWCQRDKSAAQAYTAGLWDLTVRSAFIIRPSEA
jgi:hypothetical protein